MPILWKTVDSIFFFLNKSINKPIKKNNPNIYVISNAGTKIAICSKGAIPLVYPPKLITNNKSSNGMPKFIIYPVIAKFL